MAAALCAMCVVAIVVSLTPSVSSFIVYNVVIGICGSITQPVTASLPPTLFAPELGATAQGVIIGGIGFGAGMTLVVSGGLHSHWTHGISIFGSVGLIMALAIALGVPSVHSSELESSSIRGVLALMRRSYVSMFRALTRAPSVLIGILVFVFLTSTTSVITSLSPQWLVIEKGADAGSANTLLGWDQLIFTPSFTLVFAVLADATANRCDISRYVMAALLHSFVVGIYFIGLSLPYSSNFASSFWLAQSLGSQLLMAVTAPVMSQLLRVIPHEIHASTVAIMFSGNSLFTAAFSQLAGDIVARLESDGDRSAYTHVLCGLGGIGLIPVPLLLLLHCLYERDQKLLAELLLTREATTLKNSSTQNTDYGSAADAAHVLEHVEGSGVRGGYGDGQVADARAWDDGGGGGGGV